MIELALKATLTLLIAGVLDLGLLRRRGSAAARHMVWTLAVVVLLALPAMTIVLPAWRVVALPALPAPAATIEPYAYEDAAAVLSTPTQTTTSAAPVVQRAGGATTATDGASADAARPFAPRDVLLLVYGAGVLLLLLRVVAEHLMVRRLARACTPLHDAQWEGLLASVRASLGVRRDIELLDGPGAVMPLAWGVRRPSVLLPATADGWSLERRRAVLLHEVAHVARHDCATQTLASIARALYWPHPGVWLAARRLRIERELACDELAVSAGIARLDYAEHLLEIARSYRAPRLSAGAVAMARSSVEGRLRALIVAPRATGAMSRRAKVGGLVAACALLLPLAAAAPAMQSQEFSGRWDLRRAEPGEGAQSGQVLHLMLRAPGLNTQYLPVREFEGLSLADLGETRDARFALRRGPGTFRFEGGFANGRGSGAFTFTPDARFADALVARGMTRPTDAQLFTLARHGFELDFLDELAAQGYPQPTTESFVRTSLTGVDVALLRELRANRTRFRTLEELVDRWNNGDVGSAPPPPPAPPAPEPSAPIVPAADIAPVPGVEPAPAAPPAPAADVADPPSAPPVIDGEPADVAPPSAPPPPPAPPGSPDVTPTTGTWRITAVRGGGHYIDLFWDDESNWSRAVSLGELTTAPDNGRGLWLILRDAGRFEMNGSGDDRFASGDLLFTPNRAFVEKLRELDLVPARGVRDHDLKNLVWGNVGEREIRAFKRQFDDLSFGDVVTFAIRGVTPGYVDDIRAAGVVARTPRDIIDLRFAGITPADVRALREAGQRDMSAEAILAAARAR